MADSDDILATAIALADAARAACLPFFRAPDLSIDNKDAGAFDPVTEGDRAAERAMRAVLARQRPDDGIIGEEFGNTPGRSGMTWVLDPIDGTRAFMAGAPTWGVLIAAGPDGQAPTHGIIDQPFIGERFIGTPGAAWTEGPLGRRNLAVRRGVPAQGAILMSTYPEVGTSDESAAFARVAERVRLTRYGLDCYAYALLAAGQVDLVIEAGLAPYDIQGPMAVIRAAGGIVTGWDGGPAERGGRVIAAADPDLHAQACGWLAAG